VGRRPRRHPRPAEHRGTTLSLLLFDTTFLIDAERAGDTLDDAVGDDDDIAIAAVTVAELRVGVDLATPRYRRSRQAFLDDVLTAIPVLPYDVETAHAHADLLTAVRAQGRPRGAHDLIIAATARASRRTVLTADLGAFSDLPEVVARSHRGSAT
jgi:tRNA(fMet)-specific endonuclease VapC